MPLNKKTETKIRFYFSLAFLPFPSHPFEMSNHYATIKFVIYFIIKQNFFSCKYMYKYITSIFSNNHRISVGPHNSKKNFVKITWSQDLALPDYNFLMYYNRNHINLFSYNTFSENLWIQSKGKKSLVATKLSKMLDSVK